MCPTPAGRLHTRVACMTLPFLLGAILWLITGRPDFLVIMAVLLVLGAALDTAVYPFAIRWQPPWMTGVLAIFEFGLLLVLGSLLELDLSFVEALLLYIAAWLLFISTKIALLPIFSLTYLESAGEFRRIAWSIPPSKELLPVLAADTADEIRPGKLLSQASGAHAQPLPQVPSLSGAHQIPAELRR
jgi:hypothetical protein